MEKNKDAKIDLTLLKKLVGELEATLATADGIKAEKTEENVSDYVVEMSKCAGLAAGVAEEATLLIADVRQAIRYNTSPAPKDDTLSSILGVLKGSGGSGLPGSN